MKSRYIDINKILRILYVNNGFFFYNPNNKTCVIGSAIKLSNEVEGLVEDTENVSFYAFPFFDDLREKELNLWKEVKMGEVKFPYNYTFSFLYENDMNYKTHTYHINSDDYKNWESLFNNVMKGIKEGKVEKVVASREIIVSFDIKVDFANIMCKLLNNNPRNFVFAYVYGDKAFIGATPEILVEKKEDHILSYALAGTRAKVDDKRDGEILLKDIKNNYEHKIVVDAIVDTMRNASGSVTVGNTELMELKNLFHLKTPIVAIDTKFSIVEWAKMLHPTPAMGGKPQKIAMEIIRKYEKHDRGLFAAPIGIVRENGDVIFVVGIRSALINKNEIYAYAGCGIVKQSNCREEYDETNIKLRTILEAL